MRAWLIDQLSGIDNLHLADVSDPTPGMGEIVVDVEYAALNPADYYLAQSQYPAKPPLPHVLGRDGVGVIRQLGNHVTDLEVGQRVLIMRGETGVNRWGTFAQRVAVAADSVAKPPPDWLVEESACASLVYLTAYQALTQWGSIHPAVTLITGASGGVGVAAIQLAKAMGDTVVALTRGTNKNQKLKELGADHVFDAQESDWVQKAKSTLAPRRVDLAVDNIAGEFFTQVIETLGSAGRVSVVGMLGGLVPQFNTASLFFRRLKIGGVAVGVYSPDEARRAWRDVITLLHRTGARPQIDRVFPFDQLPAAFARLKEGPIGKVLLEIPKSK